MDTKTNSMLNKIRQTLAAERNGSNVQDAQLTEAENEFCAEGCSVIEKAGYKLEGFDTNDPDAVAEALEYVAEEEGGEIAKHISELLAPGLIEAAGPVIATVPSDSKPGKSYEIRLGNDGNVYCSCPAWKNQRGVAPVDRVCKHMKALAKQLGTVTTKLGKAAESVGQMLAQHFTEAAERSEAFVTEAFALITKAGYEMEGYEDASIEEVVAALIAVADEEGEDSEVTEAVGEMLAPYLDEGGGGKTYIVYVNGEEKGMIKAANHNAAEKKAQKLHPDVEPSKVSVAYTEV